MVIQLGCMIMQAQNEIDALRGWLLPHPKKPTDLGRNRTSETTDTKDKHVNHCATEAGDTRLNFTTSMEIMMTTVRLHNDLIIK